MSKHDRECSSCVGPVIFFAQAFCNTVRLSVTGIPTSMRLEPMQRFIDKQNKKSKIEHANTLLHNQIVLESFVYSIIYSTT